MATIWYEHKVERDGVNIACFTLVEKPTFPTTPVLFIHGITSQHRSFSQLAKALCARQESIVAMDMRGRGNSDKPDTGYGLPNHRDDAIKVMDHFGMKKAVIVGHSMGGFVALEVAMSTPDRIQAVALLDSGFPRRTGQVEFSEETKKGLAKAFGRLGRSFASLDEYLEYWFAGEGVTADKLSPDSKDYYLYDLGQTAEGSFVPKCTIGAAVQDGQMLAATCITAEGMTTVKQPIYVARAKFGFTPIAPPLLTDDDVSVIQKSFPNIVKFSFFDCDHYTIMSNPKIAARVGVDVEEFLQHVEASTR